ncbi:protein-L-isoaspartate O-methyltransferase family protein [Flexibacterium corallicola]|uniref:protein-L-isoaspartate O-methyltransferase family protein n=1 Tax=Flexibacterium corallicola TaxID=3037259 RepID=UPI00286EBAFF|nr:protein-L-isoaspartate O-methyltransferase [Pseudovibrio sp. M1P-2-3]
MVDYAQLRTKMVDNQLRTNDITDLRILGAMGEVAREHFVPEDKRSLAYIDEDLPVLDDGSRKSAKPHIFGKMVQLAAFAKDDVVLVVGASSGYGVSVISKLCDSVVGIEQDAKLVEIASRNLVETGIENAAVVEATHKLGYPAEAPYDVIFVDGAVEEISSELFEQLKDGGRLVAVEGLGGAGVANLYQKSAGTVSSRFGFNANAPHLPGFEQELEFKF